MSIGIYKYTNKINNKIYIGLSVNIEHRYSQHLSESKKEQPQLTIDKAIKKYGIENFIFEIIELCDIKELDEKERYWINYYNSYNQGYNNTLGGRSLKGEAHPRAILKETDVWDIREQYGQGIKRSVVFKPYLDKGITKRCLLKVWNNENWKYIHSDVYTLENKQKHKKQTGISQNQKGLNSFERAIKQQEIDLWLKDYNNGLTINAISKKYNRDNSTVEKYIHKPIAIQKVKYSGRIVQNIETKQIFKSINAASKWANCGATTLTRHLNTDGAAGKVPGTQQIAHWIEIL